MAGELTCECGSVAWVGDFCLPCYHVDYQKREAEREAKKKSKKPAHPVEAPIKAKVKEVVVGSKVEEKTEEAAQELVCKSCGRPAQALKKFNKKNGMHQSCLQAKKKAKGAKKTAVKKSSPAKAPAKERGPGAEEADATVRRILKLSMAKYEAGEKKYGVIYLSTDPRNFIKEAKEEMLDTMVYCAFQIAKLEQIEEGLNKVGALFI